MPLDDRMRLMGACHRSASSAVVLRGEALRAGQAVAHGAASYLGLGNMPWLATYVIGRDLVERVIDPWLPTKR